MEKEIATFFRDFALRILAMEHADPNSPREVKQALVNHFEEIYPAFCHDRSLQAKLRKGWSRQDGRSLQGKLLAPSLGQTA